MSVIAR